MNDNMQPSLSENTKAMLMLTHYFNRSDRKLCKPLTDNGFGYLAHWMNTNSYKPHDLLDNERLESFFADFNDEATHFTSKSALSGFMRGLDKTVSEMTRERFESLLSRGMALSQALEKWQSAGIWILSRADKAYPIQIKRNLREKSPAILFGIGNIDLLNYKGIGFVGSRNCDKSDEAAAIHYVDEINNHGFQVVSGAAKGIDSIAMHRSLSNNNKAIGILGDSLFKACGDSQWREYLRNGQLLLLSPFDPEASFGRGENAMQRNKYIYFLSEAVVAICSGVEGGTISGVKENLVAGWCPQFVSCHDSPNTAGNKEILDGFPSSKTRVKTQAQAKAITPEESLISLIAPNDNVSEVQLTPENEMTTEDVTELNNSAEAFDSVDMPADNGLEVAGETLQYELNPADDQTSNDLLSLPAFLGKSSLAGFYFELLDVFKAEQTNDDEKVTLTEDQILERLSVLISMIGKTAVKKLLTHFQDHELLIRQGRAKNYQIIDIENNDQIV
ncbi:DNA-processing protein DprA [Photobacterium damselae]|uniref:DNA-processing protein DprA n=1 Tax=Photobacterium damselae TaxID=38293 RepID=UPI001EFC34EE|nr:DNA-processing protein DprA [Photobacterium damselae]MCG9778068.1 DNA-processing protein DprA [Photobacterium damselae]